MGVWEKLWPMLAWIVALTPMVAWYVIRIRKGKSLTHSGPSIAEVRSRDLDPIGLVAGLIENCNEVNDQAAIEHLMEEQARDNFAFDKSSLELALYNGYDPELDELIAHGRTAEAYQLARDRAEASHMANNTTAERTYRKYVEKLGSLPYQSVEL